MLIKVWKSITIWLIHALFDIQWENLSFLFQNQEKELDKLRAELSSLREEESKMEQQVEGGKQQLDLLIKSQNDLQLQISQVWRNHLGHASYACN